MKVNEIVFCRKDDETKEELFQRVGEQLKLLLGAGYLAVVRYDEPGIGVIVIEYQHDENLDYWGCVQPMWVTPEEAEKIICMRENNCNREVILDDEE